MTKGKSFANLTKHTTQFISKKTKDLNSSMLDVKSRLTASPMQALAEGLSKDQRRTVAEEEIVDKEKLIEEWEDHMPRIYRIVREEVETLQAYKSAGNHVGETFSNYSGKVHHPHPEFDLLSSFLNNMGTVENQLSQLKADLAESLTNDVVTPLRDFTNKDLIKAKEAKRLWNQARLANDASLSKFQGLMDKGAKDAKVKESEAELSANKVNFENVNRKTKRQLADIIEFGELEHIKTMLSYLNSYKKFFESGAKFLDWFAPKLKNMQEFYDEKATIREKRLEEERQKFLSRESKRIKSMKVEAAKSSDTESSDEDQLISSDEEKVEEQKAEKIGNVKPNKDLTKRKNHYWNQDTFTRNNQRRRRNFN